MKTRKTCSILAIILIICMNASAQSNIGSKKGICDELMKMPFIFEGKVVSFKNSYKIKIDENSFRNYNSYLVEVKKVIKGDIQKGTINVIVAFGKNSDGPSARTPPSEGLYFCTIEAVSKDSNVSNTNSKSLEYYCGESMANGELKKDNNDNLIDYFPTLSEFYDYLRANYGVKIEGQ